MEYMLYILIMVVIIQSAINIFLLKELRKGKNDRKSINKNLDKSAKVMKYLMDKLKSRDIINKN
ncbi:MAG: hypothetical protein SLAVMIC_00644 [uncultured marine phage]|uniref:Uncharacterized protein n=1 Tax=uncultured marine phage TaxID=707152 RepID=A0A8D9FQE3_9VIRU|nr:MAG: hypothetical protein SLAVMIC_00644 [uncultured marine phage]